MKAGWTIIWRGRNCVAYRTQKYKESYSLDPDEAVVFKSWFAARRAAGITKGLSVVRCWT